MSDGGRETLETFSCQYDANGKTYLDAKTGLSRCQTVVHISDAGANGKRHCKDYNKNSIWQLDWYHLGKHVRVLNKIDRKWKKEVWELIEVEQLDEAITSIESGLEKMRKYEPPNSSDSENYGKKTKNWWKKRIKEVEGLATYLKNNGEGIYAVKKLVGTISGEHIPFGSGPMERLCGVNVAHRILHPPEKHQQNPKHLLNNAYPPKKEAHKKTSQPKKEETD